MRKKNKSNNISNFISYSAFIITITLFFILVLTIKNECLQTQIDIGKLHQLQISNSNIVKELQSNREYFMSEKYLSEFLANNMNVVAPETLLIEIDVHQ